MTEASKLFSPFGEIPPLEVPAYAPINYLRVSQIGTFPALGCFTKM